jgi:protein SCO1
VLSKKALLAIGMVVLLPLVSYMLVKTMSEDAVNMPRRYFPDSVISKVVDGKSMTDTVWHSLTNISLVNQLGDSVSLDDIKGSIIIANFFFTRCPSICPTLTRNMKELQDAMKMKDFRKKIDSSYVRFISFSVDPERDSAEVLKRYADRYGVNHDTWWMLTGPKKTIYDYAFNELKLGLQDGSGIDSNFIHSEKFVLIDRARVVRGYYNGLDSASMSKLAEDLTLLMLEKDKKKKRKLF